MTSHLDAQYRLKVALGFLAETNEDVNLTRWRSAVDNAQLAVENAAKAVLAMVGPVGRTHNPATQLRQIGSTGLFPASAKSSIERLASLAEQLGFDVHMQTDYGDEIQGRTPWELFDAPDAEQALAMAKEAIGLAQALIAQTET